MSLSSKTRVTVSSTIKAFAPVYVALTLTVGGATSGYSEIGKTSIETSPPTIIINEITIAKIGRLIKVTENIDYLFSGIRLLFFKIATIPLVSVVSIAFTARPVLSLTSAEMISLSPSCKPLCTLT